MERSELVARRVNVIKEYFDMICAIRRLGLKANRANLSKSLDISLPTVTRYIQDLRREKALLGDADDTHGTVALNPRFASFLGIHLGASHTRFVFSDFQLRPLTEEDYRDEMLKKLRNRLLANDRVGMSVKYTTENQPDHVHSSATPEGVFYELEMPNEDRDFRRLYAEVNYILEVILSFIEDHPSAFPLLCIGIALPGILDRSNGVISHSPGMRKLKGVVIKDLISKSTEIMLKEQGIPWFIEHDTECALIHEREYHYAPNRHAASFPTESFRNANKPNWALLYYGIGLGSAFCLNNQIYRGASNAVGELGHAPSPVFSVPDLKPLYGIAKDKDEPLTQEEQKKFVYRYYKNEESVEPSTLALRKDVRGIPICVCEKDNCLETAMRAQCFNASSPEQFLRYNTPKTLRQFDKLNPVQYGLFLQYVGYIIGMIISVANVNMLLLSGSTLCGITALRDELRPMRYEGCLKPSANACEVELGINYDSCSARGAAIAAFYKCHEDNYEKDPIDPLHIFWKELSFQN